MADCRRGAPASEAVICDIGERDQAEALVRDALSRHGRIDVLVNNAGIPMRVHATRLTAEQVERVMRINFLGAVWTTLAALPSMLERRTEGVITSISRPSPAASRVRARRRTRRRSTRSQDGARCSLPTCTAPAFRSIW